MTWRKAYRSFWCRFFSRESACTSISRLFLPTSLLAPFLIAAVVSKFIGCGLGALGLGKAKALRIGVGMIPRGEVGMIVAQIGLAYGILSETHTPLWCSCPWRRPLWRRRS